MACVCVCAHIYVHFYHSIGSARMRWMACLAKGRGRASSPASTEPTHVREDIDKSGRVFRRTMTSLSWKCVKGWIESMPASNHASDRSQQWCFCLPWQSKPMQVMSRFAGPAGMRGAPNLPREGAKGCLVLRSGSPEKSLEPVQALFCTAANFALSGPLDRLNAILSLLQPLDRYRAPSAIGSAIGRPLSRPISHPRTGRSPQPPRSKPLRGLNRAIVAL